ncbi:hypothetical protein PG990_014695 [Apiospora arundinis]
MPRKHSSPGRIRPLLTGHLARVRNLELGSAIIAESHGQVRFGFGLDVPRAEADGHIAGGDGVAAAEPESGGSGLESTFDRSVDAASNADVPERRKGPAGGKGPGTVGRRAV